MDLVELMADVVRGRLHTRNLWNAPPSFIGYPEFERWTAGHPLHAVATDAIDWAIIERLRALCARMDAGDNVDGFVFRNVDNFLSHRQQLADPVGHTTYRWVTKVATKRSLVHGDGALSRDELTAHVLTHPRWTPLMRALSLGGVEAGREVTALFVRLEKVAPNGFDPGDLVVLLRNHARPWHDALIDHGADDDGEVLRQNRILAARQVLEALEEAIEASGGQHRKRRDLRRLLDALKKATREGDVPTQAELSGRLDIKKATLSDHFRRLRQLIGKLDPDDSGDVPLP